MTPVQFTNGVEVRTAETPGEFAQFVWDGWWSIDVVAPPIPLHERFAFGPVRPANPRPGVVYFPTPV